MSTISPATPHKTIKLTACFHSQIYSFTPLSFVDFAVKFHNLNFGMNRLYTHKCTCTDPIPVSIAHTLLDVMCEVRNLYSSFTLFKVLPVGRPI